jgi:hypothetical protein
MQRIWSEAAAGGCSMILRCWPRFAGFQIADFKLQIEGGNGFYTDCADLHGLKTWEMKMKTFGDHPKTAP